MGEQPRKKARTAEPAPKVFASDDPFAPGGLYDFLPAPDPAKDKAAKVEASKNAFARPKLPPEERSRVIFLDVDGVLLPVGSLETVVVDGVPVPIRDSVRESDFSTAALGNLRSIVQQTGATIVLSSEWRRTEKLKSSINAVLKAQDLPGLRDSTEIFSPKIELVRQGGPIMGWVERRAREISKWMKDHPEITAWVVLDDLDFALADSVRAAGTSWIKYRSVHTHDVKCITSEDCAAAVQILLNPPPEPVVLKKRRAVEAAEDSDTRLVSTEDQPDRIRLG